MNHGGYDTHMAGSASQTTLPRRSSMRRVFAVCLVFFGLLAISPLGAHTEVFERAPIAGQPVGGSISQVDISFWAPVLSSNITLAGPDGEAIVVDTTQLTANDRIATTTFPELTEEGRYTVTHSELASDGDLQTAEWFFIFDADSENQLIPLSSVGAGSGPNWILLVAISGVVLIVAGLMWPKRAAAPARA